MAQAYQRPDQRDAEDKIREFTNRAGDAANMAAAEGAKAYKAVEQGAEDAYAATRKFVEEQPLLALAGATAFAFALGALWKATPSRPRYGYAALDRMADYMEPRYRALRSRYW